MKKRILLAALALFSTVSILLAQGPQQMPPEDRAKKTVERLKPELNLTDQQQKDILPVYTDFYTAFSKLFEGGNRPTPEDRQKLTGERDDKLKKILNEDQMKKLAEVEEKMRQERRQGGGGGK